MREDTSKKASSLNVPSSQRSRVSSDIEVSLPAFSASEYALISSFVRWKSANSFDTWLRALTTSPTNMS